jgi:lipid-binding SYLF domain-containing protein
LKRLKNSSAGVFISTINTAKTLGGAIIPLMPRQMTAYITVILRLHLVEFTAWTGWNECQRGATLTSQGRIQQLLAPSTEEVLIMTKMSSKLPRRLLVLGTGFLLLAGMAWSADDKDASDIDKRLDASAKVLNEIMATPDKAIPDKVMSDAKCVAVIPSMVKIAVGFGGSHGKGVATCRTESGKWSAPAPITITGGSWGLQLGGQAVDIVMIVTNENGMQHLLSSKFKLGADASAAAGPVGRDAAADTDVKMRAEVLTYSRARGIFAGIDLNGSAITQDKDETRILYGDMIPFSDILDGKVRPRESSATFLTAVRKYSGQAAEHGQLKPSAGTVTTTASR